MKQIVAPITNRTGFTAGVMCSRTYPIQHVHSRENDIADCVQPDASKPCGPLAWAAVQMAGDPTELARGA